MRTGTRVFLVLLALAAALASDGGFIKAGTSGPERVRFRIRTVEESGGASSVVSESTVEGPPGTDFDVSLQGERFRMSARFLTDPVGGDRVRMRARLETRRFYGYSEQKLPLYEEDMQEETLEVGFDESVVLLPFGRGGGADRLRIEITPEPGGQGTDTPSGKPRPLEINIQKPSPGGSVSVQAWKSPHRFYVEALLMEDGREVARGASDFLIEEPRELLLLPTPRASGQAAASPLSVRLTVNKYSAGRPSDFATIGFDLYGTDPQGTRRDPLGLNWSGVGELGSDLSYDLSNVYLKGSGKRYELRFRIKLAPGEDPYAE